MMRGPKAVKKPLSDLEELTMDALWAGATTAEHVRAALASRHPMKDSTVRTVLRRLEEKGYVTHGIDGRTYLYRPVDQRHNVAAQAVGQIIDRFCNGSLEQLLVGMVDSEIVDSKELERLAKQIAAARKSRRRRPQ
jgi:predicted transcriptional regulator